MKIGRYIVAGSFLAVLAGGLFAQFGNGGYRVRPPVDVTDRKGVPDWKIDPDFKDDLFTFVRVKWTSTRGFDIWSTDFPDAELNFSFRLQQLTSMKVNPQPKDLALTDEALFDYPFIYMLEVGSLEFTEEEVVALKRYLLNGGFLMVDDFWGEYAWENFHRQIKRVFPDAKQEPQELPLDHEIFRCVYELKEKPQIPGIDDARSARLEGSNRTWERWDAKEPHYKAIFDDKGRMMVIICHNTDLGDGWEREGEEEWYFHEFSEKKAYPLGINIVFYAMTH
jgi:hypothetical protein